MTQTCCKRPVDKVANWEYVTRRGGEPTKSARPALAGTSDFQSQKHSMGFQPIVVELQSDYLPLLAKEVEQCVIRHQQLYKDLKDGSFLEMSDEQLLQLFNQVIHTCGPTISYYKATNPLGTEQLIEAFRTHFSEEELHILSLSSHLDIMNLEQFDWLELLKQSLSKTKLLEHAGKHSWIVLSHFTYAEVLETLTHRYHDDRGRQNSNNILSAKQKLKEKQEIILQNNEKYLPLVYCLQAINSYRTTLKGCWTGIDFYLIPLFNEICRRRGECLRDLNRYYRIEDIMRLIDSGEKLSEGHRACKCYRH